MLFVAVVATLTAAPSVAVIEFTRVNVTPELAAFAAEHVGQALGDRGLKVVTQGDMRAILAMERQKALLGCADDAASCSAELAQALGVDLILTGALARLGSAVQVNLRVLEARTGAVRARFSDATDDESGLPALLTRGASALADALALPAGAPPPLATSTRLRGPSPAGWAFLGAGLAAAAAGGTLVVLQEQAHQALRAPASQGVLTAAEAEATRDRGKAFQVAGPVLLGVGGAALATGLVLWLRGPREGPVASAVVGPGGAAVVVTGAF